MAGTPKQQRIDPENVEQGVQQRAAARSGGAKPAATPKKGRPTPKRPKAAPAAPDAAARRGGSGSKSGRAAKNVPPTPRPATARDWIAGARPQTLILSLVPVLLGTATASLFTTEWYSHWARALLCLAVAFALQIGVNFANDYSDGIRGTDTVRQGPRRLVGSGAAKPRTVLTVALVFFGLAAVAGILLAAASGQWWILAVGAVCIVAAWFYTGGTRPYGYRALGELAVFVFFGLVATAGTMFVQVGTVNLEGWIAAAISGLFACAVLMSNNLRDRERDAVSGKRTLVVLLGPLVSRILYAVFLLLPYGLLAFFVLFYFNAGYVYFTLIAAIPAAVIAVLAKSTAEHLIVLRLSVLTALVFALGLSAAIAF